MPATKTPCPVSREQFNAAAKPITVTIGDRQYTAVPKQFGTGSMGWNVNDKFTVEVGGKFVTCQVGLNLTIANSKDVPK